MSKPYSQWMAFKALCIAALRSISKSPSSVIFTIAFPLIFILVFGFLGNTNIFSTSIAFSTNSQMDNPIVKNLSNDKNFKIIKAPTNAKLNDLLAAGDIAAILEIHKSSGNALLIQMRTASSHEEQGAIIKKAINKIVLDVNPKLKVELDKLATVNETVVQSRSAKPIDFILPGQLGFSLLASSVFGTAFVFYNLRQTLVLKRYFATPVSKTNILLAEGTARVFFQLAGALLILLIGYFFLGFTLANGIWSIINVLILCVIGLLVFMSFGFIISGIATSESVIPPLSNVITLPQFLLAGTFFSVSNFPSWLQPISYALPLTYFNDAIRRVAVDGASLWAVKTDILVMCLWGAVGYFAASRLFKWE